MTEREDETKLRSSEYLRDIGSGRAVADAEITASRFREVLGQYPTGIAVVAACDADGAPVGMVVGSFGSVSLDPPLVAFMPDKKSSTWDKLQKLDGYCVNVLGAHQLDVCRDLASKRPDKFASVAWERSASGNPVIAGSIALIECVKEAVHEAGDHFIVLGRVVSLAVGEPHGPLLFHRGGYGTFQSHPPAAADSDRGA